MAHFYYFMQSISRCAFAYETTEISSDYDFKNKNRLILPLQNVVFP